MTTLRAPTPGRFSRNQLRLIASLLTTLTVTYLVFLARAAWLASLGIGETVLHAPARQGQVLSTWGKVLNADTASVAVLKCQFQTVCAGWSGESFQRHFDLQTAAAPFMVLLLGMAFAWRSVPDTRVRKDPGQGRWASLTDAQIGEVVDLPPRGRAESRERAQLELSNPRSLYAGHLIPAAKDGFAWRAPHLVQLRERDRHENVLVMGAPGSGKTRGLFRQNIALDAKAGRTAIVFDMKWPQMDSGFGDLILFWRRLRRPVYVFAPFSESSMRIPLLDGIDNLDEALKLSRAIIAPPEYKDEAGAYYKDNERRALAAMILTIAQGPTPNMRELQRLGQMTVAELRSWYNKQSNPEIQNALKAMFDAREDKISDTLAGVVNKLQIFYTASVSRATSAGEPGDEEEVIDLHRIFREGGLLVIGIEGKHILDGNGEILLQLIKRRIDRAMLDVADESKGGRLPRTATYYLDELPSLGRLPYLMSNLATLRSRGVCMMLGVQNSEQGSVVYNRDYWKALSTNNIGTRIEFVRGTSGEDAETLSKEIGETTVETETQSRSGHALFSMPWSVDARKGQTVKLDKRPLLSVEEIKRYPRNLAVAFTKGQNPMLVATPALDQEVMDLLTPDGRQVQVRNGLFGLWKAVMGSVTDIEGDTRALVRSLSVTRTDGAVMKPVKDAAMLWQEWLSQLVAQGAQVRRSGEGEKVRLRVLRASLPDADQLERDLLYFEQQGWLGSSQDGTEVTLTAEGLKVAGRILERSLQEFEVTGPALYWARTHKEQVWGFPGGPQDETQAVAHYTPETLQLPEQVARGIWGVVPDLPREEQGDVTSLLVNLTDPEGLAQAIERARQPHTTPAAAVSSEAPAEKRGKLLKRPPPARKGRQDDTRLGIPGSGESLAEQPSAAPEPTRGPVPPPAAPGANSADRLGAALSDLDGEVDA